MQKACCNIASLVDFCILQDNVQFSILNSQSSLTLQSYNIALLVLGDASRCLMVRSDNEGF